MIKVGINGFGRIGRFVFQLRLETISKSLVLTTFARLTTWHTC